MKITAIERALPPVSLTPTSTADLVNRFRPVGLMALRGRAGDEEESLAHL